MPTPAVPGPRQHPLGNELSLHEVFQPREVRAGQPIVARLLGRRFDHILDNGVFEQPYDPRFGKAMLKTLSHLLATLGASFGYAERTELSLFAIASGGDGRRLLSRVAGEASGKLSLLLGEVATFDARLYEFPSLEVALDYFHWRQQEALGTAIDRYCMHVLSQSGADAIAVPSILDGLDSDEKMELLSQNSLDFAKVPSWQRRGASVSLKPVDNGHAQNGSARLIVDLELPVEDQYADYLRRLLTQ